MIPILWILLVLAASALGAASVYATKNHLSDDKSTQEKGDFVMNAESLEKTTEDCSRYPWLPACQSDNYFDGGWSDGYYRGAEGAGQRGAFRGFRGRGDANHGAQRGGFGDRRR